MAAFSVQWMFTGWESLLDAGLDAKNCFLGCRWYFIGVEKGVLGAREHFPSLKGPYANFKELSTSTTLNNKTKKNYNKKAHNFAWIFVWGFHHKVKKEIHNPKI